MRDVEAIEALIRPILEVVQAELVQVVLRGKPNNQVLEIYIDSDSVVSADLCSQVSRNVAAVLDRTDNIRGHYVLVVSSPGLDRPLTTLRQYRRNIGRPLDVMVLDAGQKKRIHGSLTGCSETGIELSVGNGTSLSVAFSSIVDARVSLPW